MILMSFWWCAEHAATQNGVDIKRCWKHDWQDQPVAIVTLPCRMIPVEFSIPDEEPEMTEPLFTNTHGTW